jgi:uncharacterized membrane protein YeaQ/YmgE (transglycosylase-associated protein family)
MGRDHNNGVKGGIDMVGDIVWAVITGAVLGYLAKLLLPGRQDIPAWATIGAGIVAALLAGLVAGWLGVKHTSGVDWIRHGIQVVFAVIAVYLTARIMGRRRTTGRGVANY